METVLDAEKVELLLYHDRSFSYIIKSANVEKCTNCMTLHEEDIALRGLILESVAGLEAELQRSRLDAARKLLTWIASVSDAGTYREKSPLQSPTSLTSSEMYKQFGFDRYAGSCGTFSVLAKKIFELFGYEAITIDIGIPGTRLTHVTTLLKIDEKFYVFDPTKNATFFDGSRYVDIDTVLAAAKNHQRYVPFPVIPFTRQYLHSNGDVTDVPGVDFCQCVPMENSPDGSVCMQDGVYALALFRKRLFQYVSYDAPDAPRHAVPEIGVADDVVTPALVYGQLITVYGPRDVGAAFCKVMEKHNIRCPEAKPM